MQILFLIGSVRRRFCLLINILTSRDKTALSLAAYQKSETSSKAYMHRYMNKRYPPQIICYFFPSDYDVELELRHNSHLYLGLRYKSRI